MGIKAETYGSLLVPIMMNKLAEELRLIITRHFKGGVWQFKELMEKFQEEIESRERCNFMSRQNRGGLDPKGGEPTSP